MCSSTSRERTRSSSRSRRCASSSGSGHSSSASSHSTIAARWSSQVSSSRCRALRESSSRRQPPTRAAVAEELLLQLVELPGEEPAQLEVAVDHVVDHAQHQVGRAGRHARAGAALGGRRGLVLQPVGEELAHLAVGRMDGQQDAVEDDEADRAGVDHARSRSAAPATAARPRRSPRSAPAARRLNTRMSYAEV